MSPTFFSVENPSGWVLPALVLAAGVAELSRRGYNRGADIAGYLVDSEFLEDYIHNVADLYKYVFVRRGPPQIVFDAPGDSVFNQNNFHYLLEIQKVMPDYVIRKLPVSIQQALREHCQEGAYNPRVAYNNIYKSFFEELDPHILSLYDEYHEADEANFSRFIDAIFANDNGVLERTYEKVKDTISSAKDERELRTKIKTLMIEDDAKAHNTLSPSYKETLLPKFINCIESTHREQYTTNISTVRHYSFTPLQLSDATPVVEYRFGTQSQRVNTAAIMSPFFEVWCKSKKPKQDNKISHIYFNNLGLHRRTTEGRKEKASTKMFNEFELKHPHVAFITLPADKGLMDKSVMKSEGLFELGETIDTFKQIAMQRTQVPGVRDFFISDNIRQLLYPEDDEQEDATLSMLLDCSVRTLGFEGKETLTGREKHALYYQFIKFELTNFIIDTLRPVSINFACKDAIDRSGASSLYYNLLKSLETNSPMTKEEFERGLHAPAVMVKGRPINHHSHMLSNALTFHIKAQPALIAEKCPWLEVWCKAYNKDFDDILIHHVGISQQGLTS